MTAFLTAALAFFAAVFVITAPFALRLWRIKRARQLEAE